MISLVCSPTHVQLSFQASTQHPRFVITKPPPRFLLYVTLTGLPPPADQGLTLFCPGPCVGKSDSAYVFMSVPVHFVHVSMSLCPCWPVCSFVCVCAHVHAGPWSSFYVCLCVYVKEKFACPCLSEWLGLS